MTEVQVARAGSFDDIPIYALADGSRGEFVTYHVHTQDDPQAVWQWDHGLGTNPTVRTWGTDGTEVEGDVTYPVDNSRIRVEFGGAMSGIAYYFG